MSAPRDDDTTDELISTALGHLSDKEAEESLWALRARATRDDSRKWRKWILVIEFEYAARGGLDRNGSVGETI